MNYRKMIIGLVAAALIGSTVAIAQPAPADGSSGASSAVGTVSALLNGADATDEVVEGHTVYSEIEIVNGSDQAAAVINVENRTQGQVLWFDDSFLHRERAASACGGSVWATHSTGVLLPDLSMYENTRTYEITTQAASGLVTWTISQVDGPDGTLLTRAWAVEVDCPVTEESYVTANEFLTQDPANGGADGTPSDVPALEYNAVLWFEMGELGPFVQGSIEQAQFGEGGYDAETHDTTEGNSHPYNPNASQPAVMHNHSTVQVNLYYLENNDLSDYHEPPSFFNNYDFANYHEDEEPGQHEGVT